MKAKFVLIVLFILSLDYVIYSQDSIPITVSTAIIYGDTDGWIHLKITDTISKIIWYDSLAVVSTTDSFKDTIYLDSGVYKCVILQQDINVDLPRVNLDNGDYVKIVDDYYLFSLPSQPAKIISKDSIPLTIHTRNIDEDNNGKFHFRISESTSDDIWYERFAFLPILSDFDDIIYLDSGTYKCEIFELDMPYLEIPIITQDDGHIVKWGYPDYEYYLFSLPGVNLNTFSNLTVTACDSYLSASSKYVWTESGIYMDTISNQFGYDSIMTINLSITTLDNSVTQEQGVLTAIEPDASYQWIVCNSGNIIDGANSESYTPIVNGLYAVRITKNNCEVISSCYSVMVTNIYENNFETSILFFPNPFSDILNIYFEDEYEDLLIIVKDISGRILTSLNYKNQNNIQINTNHLNCGVYFMELLADKQKAIYKVIKN